MTVRGKQSVAEHSKSEVFLTFATLGLYAYGGPTAHFALFRKVLSEDKAWVTPQRYDGYLALCQFLPGPGSSQMAAVLGWVRAGRIGAVLAMLGFALPSLVLMTAAGLTLPRLGSDLANGAITGLMAAVAAVVGLAIWSMIRATSKQPAGLVLALASASVLLVSQAFGVFSVWLQPGLIALCALLGWMGFSEPASQDREPISSKARRFGMIVAAASFALVFVALTLLSSQGDTLHLANTVYRSGALVFGGGHVVLPLLQAGVVPELVSESEFLAGYGLAQAVPGPLFTFAAFVGAASADATTAAIGLGVLAGLLIFLPGLLLVFAVLPVWERLQSSRRAKGAVAGAAAGATGVLAAGFVNPVLTSLPLDWTVYALAALALIALQFGKVAPPLVVATCAIIGLLLF